MSRFIDGLRKEYRAADGTLIPIPQSVFDIVRRRNEVIVADEFDDVPHEVEYNGHYDDFRSSLGSFNDGTHDRYVPVGPPKTITTRREVPCGIQTKTTAPASQQLEQECRTVLDPYNGKTHRECRYVEKLYPGKQTIQPLECEENKTTILEGVDIDRRRYSDGYGNEINQNIVTPEIGVAKVLGPPHPVGSHPPLRHTIEYKASSSKSKSKPKSSPKASKSKSKSRAGGGPYDDEEIMYYANGSRVLGSSPWYRTSSRPSSRYYSSDVYDRYVPSGYAPEEIYGRNPVYVAPSRAPVSFNSFGLSDYSYPRMTTTNTVDVSNRNIARPFPFSARSQLYKTTSLRSYMQWLADVGRALSSKFAGTGFYTHQVDEKFDTVGTLEAYLLTAVSDQKLADAIDRLEDRGGSLFKDAGRYFPSMTESLRAYLRPKVVLIPPSRRPMVFANEQTISSYGPSIMSTYPINPVYKKADTSNQLGRERDAALQGLITLRTQINAKAREKLLGDNYLPIAQIAADDQVLAVLDAEVLALLSRLQSNHKVITNWAAFWNDNQEALGSLVEPPINRHLSKELQSYLKMFRQSNTSLDYFIPVTNSFYSPTRSSYYYVDDRSIPSSTSYWNWNRPTYTSQTIVQPPVVRQVTTFVNAGNAQGKNKK